MTKEPTTKQIREDDNEPATKGDVREAVDELAQATKKGFDEIRGELRTMKDEIIYEFKAVAENIHKDVAGANKDEISLIKDQKIPDHEERIQTLEQKAGVQIGPRHASA